MIKQDWGRKRDTCLFLFALVVSVLALNSCTPGPTSNHFPTTISTSKPTLTATHTLPTTPTNLVEPLAFPDSGFINITGEGLFKLQRVYEYSSEPTYFEGVIFAPHKEPPGVTTTGPIAYKLDVQFADGTVEVLQYIGLGNTNNLDINLTKHKNPGAGVMLAWQDISGGLRKVLYLLVSEQ